MTPVLAHRAYRQVIQQSRRTRTRKRRLHLNQNDAFQNSAFLHSRSNQPIPLHQPFQPKSTHRPPRRLQHPLRRHRPTTMSPLSRINSARQHRNTHLQNHLSWAALKVATSRPTGPRTNPCRQSKICSIQASSTRRTRRPRVSPRTRRKSCLGLKLARQLAC